MHESSLDLLEQEHAYCALELGCDRLGLERNVELRWLLGARIGLELAEERGRDEEFPEVRVGLAWGPALSRFGDVLGPVVNVASRLTSTSRPGRVLVDKALAEELKDREGFKLRRVRRTAVKGYRRLEPWSLQWSGADDASNGDDSS